MKILVTGGAGFIGSHLVEALVQRGCDVTVLDDLSTGQLCNLAAVTDDVHFLRGSVSNDRAVSAAMNGCDYVFHLAAAVGVRLVLDQPLRTVETNVGGTGTVLRHASRHGIPVLLASTSEVYGKSYAVPFREDADLVLGPSSRSRWTYATTKLMDEFLALAYWRERQLPVVVVRLFNTVGPRQTDRYGMVLPTFVRQALQHQPLTVHGDGAQTRSFTWIGDVVAAMLQLAGHPRAVGEVFNVGNPEETSILELAERVRRGTHSRSRIELIPYREAFDDGFEDTRRRVPDISKLHALTGFSPEVALDEIVERIAGYWRNGRVPVSASRRDLAAV